MNRNTEPKKSSGAQHGVLLFHINSKDLREKQFLILLYQNRSYGAQCDHM